MTRLLRTLAVVLILSAGSIDSRAQFLPDGEHHVNRERHYDLGHFRAEFELDFERRSISGKATIDLVPLRAIESVELDAIGLQVESVSLDGSGTTEFSHDGRLLRIDLPGARNPDDEIRLEVRYSARPRAGLYFQFDPGNPELQFVTTYGEGGLHANWLPIFNGPNDKFTSELRITVPEPYTVVSNGVLVETVREDGGRTTFHWKQERPHSNYLIAFYAGDFERGELEPAFGRVPLAYWVPRGQLDAGAWAFRNTKRMVEYFSRRFDYDYPWVKYDQIAMPDYPIGAMEHTGVTGHNASVLRLEGTSPDDFGGPTFDEYHTDWTAEATISHELAHHWFGDNTTCRDLSQLWLNESFASYLMMLWAGELAGPDQLMFDVELARRHYLGYVEDEHLIRPLEYHYFDSPNDIYNLEHTYLKGGAVLHMLRSILGDDPFFASMALFLDKHEYANVESHDLKVAIEEATGRNLDWFFGDWITGGGHPRFEVSYRYLTDLKQIDLQVDQVQSWVDGQDTFRLPVTITIDTASRRWNEIVWVSEETHSFLIPSAEEPRMVSFDGKGDLVAEIDFDKEFDEWLYQAEHDAVPGRMRALARLAEDHPTREATLKSFQRTIDGDSFWGIRAEAARLLGSLRNPEAERLAAGALKSGDYRIRKAAVLALPEFGSKSAREGLVRTIDRDPHPDVVGTAIVALARLDSAVELDLLAGQLERDSWHDEIRIATQRAFAELERAEALPLIRPYADPPYNQDLRQAAMEAWAAVAPTDRDLHTKLIEQATSTPYPLQLHAIEELGRLYVERAVSILEEFVESDIDANVTQNATEALEEIRRIHGEPEPAD